MEQKNVEILYIDSRKYYKDGIDSKKKAISEMEKLINKYVENDYEIHGNMTIMSDTDMHYGSSIQITQIMVKKNLKKKIIKE